jgi:hypothetical protein
MRGLHPLVSSAAVEERVAQKQWITASAAATAMVQAVDVSALICFEE